MGQLLHHIKEVFMHEDNCAVYAHVNLINGKKYFGITTQEPEKRWQNGKGYSRHEHFTNAINKYGWENFAHYVLFRNIPVEIAKNIEELLIKSHMSYDPNFGYNKTYGGELEIPTEEARKKISESMNGHKVLEETRRKISESLSKPVEAIDPESGNRALYFKSTMDAERSGFNSGHISDCCNGKRKTHAGLMWRYVKEVSDNDGDN